MRKNVKWNIKNQSKEVDKVKSKKDLINYCKGNDLQVHSSSNKIEPGFIAIRYNNNIVGCAHWNKTTVRNQLPKSRRCKINYC